LLCTPAIVVVVEAIKHSPRHFYLPLGNTHSSRCLVLRVAGADARPYFLGPWLGTRMNLLEVLARKCSSIVLLGMRAARSY
jgi:hypothetical protein